MAKWPKYQIIVSALAILSRLTYNLITQENKPVKIAYILSYKYPNYIRTQFLLQTMATIPDAEVLKAINSHKNILRYPETLIRLLWLRLKHRPDVYMLGFRGTEIYWPVRLLTLGKPLIYDEFLSPYLWIVEEHKKFKPGSFGARLVKTYAKSLVKSSKLVLSDTDAQADYSSEKLGVRRDKYLTLYVGTDEKLFKPLKQVKTKDFVVLFYGYFLPLHGMKYIVEAAKKLKNQRNIKFIIAGGATREKDLNEFLNSVRKFGLTNIEHHDWINYEDIPKYIAKADLCLGGPFGDTPQAQKVITGKTFQFLAMAKATLIGQVKESVSFIDGKNCLIVPQGSGEAIAEKIVWAYNNKDKLEAIGKQGQALYKEKFSQAAQRPKLEQALKKLT